MTHPTDYDEIAERYRDSKLLGFRSCIERYTLFSTLGDLAGLRVLDLACGDGIYACEARRRGAREVVGVDLSGEMVRLAVDRDRREGLGCAFQVGDARTLGTIGTFDRVIGAWLLNYAPTREQLLQMLGTVHRNLVPGGSFCGVNNNPFTSDAGVDFRRYGFTVTCARPATEGAPITWRFFNPDGSEFAIENYHLAPETHAAAFRETGFDGFRWVPAQLDPAVAQRDAAWWEAFLATPPMIGFTATRPR